jgi:hypothetical protein
MLKRYSVHNGVKTFSESVGILIFMHLRFKKNNIIHVVFSYYFVEIQLNHTLQT